MLCEIDLSKKSVWSLMFVVLAFAASAGCGVDPPNEGEATCAVDTDCSDGEYCNADGSCASDCDPTAGGGACASGEMCSDRGRCVTKGCSTDEDCGAGKYCESGKCKQDCDPGTDTGCSTGETCTDRGECVVSGDCVEDKDCDDAPAPFCDKMILKSYASSGTCEQMGDQYTCNYPIREKSCAWGCENGACLPDPCDGKTCNTPPSAKCASNGNALVMYQTPGTCNAEKGGKCEYTETETPCPNGCMNGKCNSGPCSQVNCNMPPTNKCNDNTLTKYAQMGTCKETSEGTKCDYSPTLENCSYKGAECKNGACKNPVTQKGGLVITEFMANPAGVADRDGEWFEVYNPGSSAVDLKDWSIASGGNTDHKITKSVSVPSMGRAVLGLDSDPFGDGTVTPDYVYDTVRLANGGDSLQIKNAAGDIVDHVFYEAGALMKGKSRKLDPSVMATVSKNDDFANWCPSLSSSETIGGGSDYGTPGAKNAACESMPCSGYTCTKPEAFCIGGNAKRPTKNMATCMKSRFNNPYCDFGVMTFNCTNQELCAAGKCESIPQNVPKKGELVITELMGNPDKVSDSKGEWIEVYNTTSGKLSLFSIVLEDNESGKAKDEYTVLDTSAEVAADSHAVFAVETDKTKNGGIDNALHYKGSHLKNSPSGMKISLVRQDGTVIDEAHYGKPKTGVSQQLDKATYKSGSAPAMSNDTAMNWCDANASYGSGDQGTPGADNRNCP